MRFSTSVLFHESVSPKLLSPEHTLGPFQFFSKIRGYIPSSRCTNGGVDTGGKWKKSSIIKVLIILYGHLWEVGLTYRYIFAFKFTLRSQQPDIVPIICHRYQQHQRNCHRCRWKRWFTLTCKYLREFSQKFETVLMGYSEAGGKLIHGKKPEAKNLVTLSL